MRFITSTLRSIALILSGFLLLLATATADTPAWDNAVNTPPADWTGPVFELSDQYPTQLPAKCTKQSCPWLFIDLPMKANLNATSSPDWSQDPVYNEYITSILDYIRQGQSADLNNKQGLQVNLDGETRWFHIPWMAYAQKTGREFVHGLTNERTAHLSDFYGNVNNETNDKRGFETWAVGMYNDIGAYTVGQSFNNQGKPVLETVNGITSTKGMPFKEGTVVVKFLFSTVTPNDVPYLNNSPKWQANRHVESEGEFLQCQRKVRDVYLVQVDVAVVDTRSPSRWVYGTFAYIDDGGKTVWDNLKPVGLQWGMDPWTFPAVPKSESIPAQQSVLNTEIKPYEHFGCQSRLAGPVDNKQSSCLSCHAGAYANPDDANPTMGVTIPPIFGFDGLCEQYSQENVNYFQTTQFPQAYSGGNYVNLLNLDTSLQMQIAVQEHAKFAADAPLECEE
ncbi:hypothetical protein [Vibrio cionasavignyae]|uniref:hypothetical protein n=1 Tax=Vibrio cionasavignyae TaxID=2910252 RepID=UPI003D0AD058